MHIYILSFIDDRTPVKMLSKFGLKMVNIEVVSRILSDLIFILKRLLFFELLKQK